MSKHPDLEQFATECNSLIQDTSFHLMKLAIKSKESSMEEQQSTLENKLKMFLKNFNSEERQVLQAEFGKQHQTFLTVYIGAKVKKWCFLVAKSTRTQLDLSTRQESRQDETFR